MGCISLYSYIKPQLTVETGPFKGSCISLYSYIKPQQYDDLVRSVTGCISLYSYIKPQRKQYGQLRIYVVYLYIPTSNHNL